MRKVYVICDELSYEPDDNNVWTLSENPDKTGWETDTGYAGYGLPKDKAEYYAKCINEYPKLLAKLELAEHALVKLDQVLMFSKMGNTVDPPTNIKTGTQMMIWASHNDHIIALNHAKKFASETLEKLKG